MEKRDNKGKWLVNVYLLVAVLHVFLLNTDMHLYAQLTKGLLMPVLLVWAYLQVGADKWLTGALAFSWAGDLLLIRSTEGENWFLMGLASFLLAHVCYMMVFYKNGRGQQGFRQLWSAYAGLAVIVFLLLSRIGPGLGDMKIPVYTYTFVIAGMAVMAIRRRGGSSATSYYVVLTGALLFIISDGMIAWDKFYAPVANARTWIMVTYIMAQYLIVQGIIWHKKNPVPA